MIVSIWIPSCGRGPTSGYARERHAKMEPAPKEPQREEASSRAALMDVFEQAFYDCVLRSTEEADERPGYLHMRTHVCIASYRTLEMQWGRVGRLILGK